MKILLTGSNGYIGSRLLELLLEQGHDVVAMVRSPSESFQPNIKNPQLQVIIADLLYAKSLQKIPEGIDAAYYLVHSMASDKGDFVAKEHQTIANFIKRMEEIKVKQVIYLGGLCSDENLSAHLASRYRTEQSIRESGLPFTIVRAGIIIGAGSASFEIIRDLTEKLPIMVAPIWINNLCQPIAVQDVLYYLVHVLGNSDCLNQSFDVGGPDVLSYKNMLLKYAAERELKRTIFVVPVLTPRLSSYWLYFVTSVNFGLASALVDSVKNEAVCNDKRILSLLPHDCLSYAASIRKAFDLIEQSPLIPSWKDSLVSQDLSEKLAVAGDVPH
ncbi:MAG: NAD(P)H-binding protein, partial [Parachlamydiaceae bacterium]|nr:NAD(P)H-binding protein [Parachlamydiaceae bacterium]